MAWNGASDSQAEDGVLGIVPFAVPYLGLKELKLYLTTRTIPH